MPCGGVPQAAASAIDGARLSSAARKQTVRRIGYFTQVIVVFLCCTMAQFEASMSKSL
jgi:hypothetical protein